MKHQRKRSKDKETAFGRAMREAIAPKEWTVMRAAREMEISHSTLHGILNGRMKMTHNTAKRFAKVFGQTPEHWLGLQDNEFQFFHD